MKKAIFLLAAMCCICTAAFANGTKIEYEQGKFMYFSLNETMQTAYVTWGGRFETSGTDDYKGDIQIPASVNYNHVDYQVTGIGDYAFCACSDLSSISFPEGLERIGNYAFRGCLGLNSVSLPIGLKMIFTSAFEDCTHLTTISLPEGLEEIQTYAFKSCAYLTSLTIPSTVKRIGDRVCDGANNLNEVYIYSDLLTPSTTGTSLWNISVPTYVSSKSFLDYKKGIFLGYENVKVLPEDDNIGEVLRPYLNLSDEEVEIYNELLKGRSTMGKPQPGPVIEIEGDDGKTLKLYKIKNVKFVKKSE